MDEIVNIDLDYYNKNKSQVTNWLCDIFEASAESLNLDGQFNNYCYFTLYLKENEPASVCRFIRFDNRKTVFCSRMVFTKEKFRGQGLARKVLDEGFKFLTEKYGCKRMISYISNDNKSSISLHKKSGYKPISKDIKFYKTNRFSFEDSSIYERNV